MDSTNAVALVLGGGAAGQAWEIGVVAGLASAGVDLTAADLVVGTSAGATAATAIRSGRSPATLLDEILDGRPGPRPERLPSLPQDVVVARMEHINRTASSAEEIQRLMGAFGLESDPALAEAVGPRRAIVAGRIGDADWPDRALLVTVIDADTGEFLALDRDSGVPLVDAVTATTALPGLVPTHPVGDRRFIDGGIRSSENADLAAGYGVVVVLAPLGGERPADAQFTGLRREDAWGTTLAAQVALLRDGGSQVVVAVPDEDSRTATGGNQMDPRVRIPVARAGSAQGVRIAPEIAALLSGARNDDGRAGRRTA